MCIRRPHLPRAQCVSGWCCPILLGEKQVVISHLLGEKLQPRCGSPPCPPGPGVLASRGSWQLQLQAEETKCPLCWVGVAASSGHRARPQLPHGRSTH